jgi:hypothetical protein
MLAPNMSINVVSTFCDVAAIRTSEPWLLEADVLKMLGEVIVAIIDTRAVRTGKGFVGPGLLGGAVFGFAGWPLRIKEAVKCSVCLTKV